MTSEKTAPHGEPVDAAPAKLPGDVVLQGQFGSVEKLDVLRHGAELWNAVKDKDAIWDYLAYGPFPDAKAFGAWLAEPATLTDPFYYAILDTQGRAVGAA